MSCPRAARSSARRFRFATRGNIAVEFALIAPVLVVLMFGGAELGWLVLAQIKNARVASTMSDLITRVDSITEADVDDIFESGRSVGSPFDYQTNGRMIISSILSLPNDGPRIVWQRSFPDGASSESRVGSTGGAANLSDGFLLSDGENVIIAEAVFDYTPLSDNLIIEPRQMYSQATNRPRGGVLDAVLP